MFSYIFITTIDDRQLDLLISISLCGVCGTVGFGAHTSISPERPPGYYRPSSGNKRYTARRTSMHFVIDR